MADEPTYTDLDELLEAYAAHRDVVALVGLSDLSTLAREVKLRSINALLLSRAPDVLNPESERFELLLETIAGATAEVEAIVGPDPQPAARRALALRAIAHATAADLEQALFPEQQLGDTGRAAYLRARYAEILGLLQGQESTGLTSAVPRPRGAFPAARAYPDPIERF